MSLRPRTASNPLYRLFHFSMVYMMFYRDVQRLSELFRTRTMYLAMLLDGRVLERKRCDAMPIM